jgi:predicted PurR-regulated permease PerM
MLALPLLTTRVVAPSAPDPNRASRPHESASRDKLSLAALLTMLVAGVVICALVVAPFVPALVWAFALIVVSNPMYLRLRGRLRSPSIAAAIAVLGVALLLLIPVAVVGWQVGAQASERMQQLEDLLSSGNLQHLVERLPPALRPSNWMSESQIGTSQNGALMAAGTQAGVWLRSALWAALQVTVALFALFFLFRDQDAVLKTVRSYMPMSDGETTYFFEELRRMTHATIFGNVVVALVQGALGGLMFALLGIPAALLWAVAMALLSLVPNAGAFLIWLPAAVFLAVQGAWGKAIFLTAWGVLVVGTIDNLLYPMLVGKDTRVHTLAVFFSVVGGLLAFGAAGLVLGPTVLAGTLALVNVLKRRTAHHRSAVEPR